MSESKSLSLNKKYFQLTPQGLQIQSNPTFEACEEGLHVLRKVDHCIQWAIGDLLNYMESKWGETYAQAVDAFDYSVGSLANMKSVAKAFEPSRRREKVPFSYYPAIQGLDKEDQETMLDQVENGEIDSLSHLRNKAKIIKKHSTVPKSECIEHEIISVCKKCGVVTWE